MAGFAVHASAAIYKWVDENGVVQFGDAPPEAVNARKQSLPPLNRYASPRTSPVELQADDPVSQAAAPTEKAESPSGSAAKIKCRKADRNDCFDSEQHRVCLLRYSMLCGELVFWKTILREECEGKRGSDCSDPAHMLQKRPMSMLLRDLDRLLPLRDRVSAQDFACLKTHGFFCDELEDESRCRDSYNLSCDELATWAQGLKEKCEESRDAYCDSPELVIDAFRPRSIEEVQRMGTRAAGRGVVVRDWLFIELDMKENDESRNAELEAVLSRLPGF
jgi:hypothetical protein